MPTGLTAVTKRLHRIVQRSTAGRVPRRHGVRFARACSSGTGSMARGLQGSHELASPVHRALDEFDLPERRPSGSEDEDLCRKHGISDATSYNWKAKYAGMTVSEARIASRVVV